MPMNADKDALRKAYLRLRRSMPPQEKTGMDAAITARVLQNEAYLAAETVFCYVSLPHEVDTRAILSDAMRRGKRVAVPRCRKNGQMDFYVIDSIGDLSPGMRGIPEPKESCPVCMPKAEDLCIVPCLAADERGCRLGYGGGYYDRYLARYSMRTLGLCYSSCLLHALPSETFDISMQMIVFDKEV